MRHFTLAAVFAGALTMAPALAQEFVVPGATPPSKAIGLAPSNQLDVNNIVSPGRLESGTSNITEAQARARIQAVGFSGITDLTQDQNGIWRAKGTFGDRTASIGIDYKGNIAAQ